MITSTIKSIQDLRFVELPNRRPSKSVSVVRIGRHTITSLGRGRVVSTQVGVNCHFPLGVNLDTTIIGLHLLGLITKDERDAQIKASKAARDTSDRRSGAIYFEQKAAELGIKLTNAQLGKIARAKEGLK